MLKNGPTPWCSHLQNSLLICFFSGEVQCKLTSKHGVYFVSQRVQFGSHLIRLYSPSVSQLDSLSIVQQTLAFSSEMSLAWLSWIQATAIDCIIYFETIVPANSRSSWSSPHVAWATLLIIIFTPLTEILHMVVDSLWWNDVLSSSRTSVNNEISVLQQ